jgi:DNA-binding transcriptional ArsR family regulator
VTIVTGRQGWVVRHPVTGRSALLRICACVDALGMDAIDSIDVLQAEVMRTLAHPRRLQIIHLLATGPRDVQTVAEELGMTQPNASQHLAVMRSTGIVERRRDGRSVRYRLADPAVLGACRQMRQVLQRRLARLSQLSRRGEVAPLEVN